MTRVTIDPAFFFSLISLLLLEVGRLYGLVLSFELVFSFELVLVLEFVGLEILLLHHIGSGSSLINFGTCVFCSRILFNIKSPNEILNRKLLPLMFQGSSKVPSRRR